MKRIKLILNISAIILISSLITRELQCRYASFNLIIQSLRSLITAVKITYTIYGSCVYASMRGNVAAL